MPYYLVIIFLLGLQNLEAKQTVCLNMIIKNESAVIRRCLESVKPLVDYWVIVDTGSEDGTQEIVRAFMKDIPGELHERPWKNFAHNRNEALALAKDKADYLLFIDADEVLEFEQGYRFPYLNKEFYYIATHYAGTRYERVQLVNSKLECQWKGAVHECLYAQEPVTRQTLEGIVDVVRTDGARSRDPQKYENDAVLLEEELRKSPENTRTVFYLAQSYKDAGNYPKALEHYRNRVQMGGWDQEIFWSLLQIAHMDEVNKPNGYFHAYQYRSQRAEPLYYLAQYYRAQKNYAAAYTISKLGLQIPLPSDYLFVEKWVYDYGMLLENSVAAYWLGKFAETKALSEQILAKKIPADIRLLVNNNLGFAEEKLKNLNNWSSNGNIAAP